MLERCFVRQPSVRARVHLLNRCLDTDERGLKERAEGPAPWGCEGRLRGANRASLPRWVPSWDEARGGTKHEETRILSDPGPFAHRRGRSAERQIERPRTARSPAYRPLPDSGGSRCALSFNFEAASFRERSWRAIRHAIMRQFTCPPDRGDAGQRGSPADVVAARTQRERPGIMTSRARGAQNPAGHPSDGACAARCLGDMEYELCRQIAVRP